MKRTLFMLIVFPFVCLYAMGKDLSEERLSIGYYSIIDAYANRLAYSPEINFNYTDDHLFLIAHLRVSNDGKYSPAVANFASGTFGSSYFEFKQGGLKAEWDKLRVTAGRFYHRDIVDSPYSLFISSEDISSLILQVEYSGRLFFYQTRWIGLNRNSTLGYPDRGANYKVYGFNIWRFRAGFQDASVYLNRYWDYEYFFNPIPQYFIQYVKGTDGRPWQEESQDNNLVGLFLDYRDTSRYFYAQWLMDDFNVHWLLPETTYNPNKMAWSAGSQLDFSFGTLGFYAALCTKYTFQATYTSEGEYSPYPYEYTYYPAVEFVFPDDTAHAINYTDNYIGYKYGENNFAFQVTYDNTFLPWTQWNFDLSASLEYSINGSKSPANPWNDLEWHTNEGTKLFDEEVQEHIVQTSLLLSKNIWWFDFSLFILLGGRFNGMDLFTISDDEPKMYVPVPGNNSLIFHSMLNISFTVKL